MIHGRLIEKKLTGAVSRNKVRLILGARQVGKTVLLQRLLPEGRSILYDLQDSTLRRRLERDPAIFSREVLALAPSVTHVGVDEIQKVPPLFDEVQYVADRNPARFQLFLTGSSGRRLRAGSANLLPGRCHVYNLCPVARNEERDFRGGVVPGPAMGDTGFPPRPLEQRLLFGSLPGVAAEAPETAAATLDAYVGNYIEEEIRREALVKDIGAFGNFLQLAAAENGTQMNLAGLSRESGIPASTLKVYYQVLVDTFLGYWIPAYRRSARKKLLTTPRFFLFDLGVANAAAGLPPGPELVRVAGGRLLEQWVALELVHRARYAGRGHGVSFWRTTTGAEVDLIFETPREDIPVEVKWTEKPQPIDARHVETFLDLHPDRASRGYVVCRTPRAQRLTRRTTAIPWDEL